MQTYKIEFSKSATKFIASRPQKEQKRILRAIYKLPNSKNVAKMKGFEHRYRLRVGSTRVIYERYDDTLKIIVIEIGNRGDVYK